MVPQFVLFARALRAKMMPQFVLFARAVPQFVPSMQKWCLSSCFLSAPFVLSVSAGAARCSQQTFHPLKFRLFLFLFLAQASLGQASHQKQQDSQDSRQKKQNSL